MQALGALEGQPDLVVQFRGLRQCYRRVSPVRDRLGERVERRFQEWEGRAIERVHWMLEFARDMGCLTRRLLAYFGEELEADCGHCGRCLGEAPPAVPPRDERPFGAAERALVLNLRREGHAALAHPRQQARFLCGLSSSAASRAGLTKHPQFGAFASMPFVRVLALVEGRGMRNLTSAWSAAGA